MAPYILENIMRMDLMTMEELAAHRNALVVDGEILDHRKTEFAKISAEIQRRLELFIHRYDLVIFEAAGKRKVLDIRPYDPSEGHTLGDTFRIIDASLDKQKFDLDIVHAGTFKKGDEYK